MPLAYNWTVHQSEWATDVAFESRSVLEPWYERWVRHALLNYDSADVLKFLGRSGRLRQESALEVHTSLQQFEESWRLKHWVDSNSQKMYDHGNVLRVETTINDEEQFWVYRPKEGGDPNDLAWRRMRRGVADTYRRAEVSEKANHRYLDALAAVDDSTRLQELTQDLEEPVLWRGRRVRGLRLFGGEDGQLLKAIGQGEFTINGFRNRDLQSILFAGEAKDEREKKRRSARMSRQIRMLRAHHLIHKIGKSHRYRLTDRGRQLVTALLSAQAVSISKLIELAA